jgi:hypothetical protein
MLALLLLWLGLTLVVGLPPILSALKLNGVAPASTIIGGVLMVIGSVLLLLDR